MAQAVAAKQAIQAVKGAADEASPTLEERETHELVFGMVGLVGAGVSTTASTLKDLLEEEYGYTVTIYKVSDVIQQCKEHCSISDVPDSGPERVKALQKMGSELRGKFSADYLARKCVHKIAEDRNDHGFDQNAPNVPIRRRRAHIIDSLKHPDEAKLLRSVYGEIFWLITVFAPEEVRERRLSGAGFDKPGLAEIAETDRNEGIKHGQHVQRCSELGDLFVRNNHDGKDPLRATLDRYLEMLFDIKVHTPRPDESAMYAAASAASRSACLSRQVGAAIQSSAGELIGVGWNDVPAYKGGLYQDDGIPNDDHRCYRWGAAICHNDDRKSKLYDRIAGLLKGVLAEGVATSTVRDLLQQSDIRNLIEYSRAVHAEMEAILSVARTQKAGLVGATMYVTTFPCHSCARHIVAAGIERVIFIEPYDKSLAGDLHNDSVSTDDRDSNNKVTFLQYEGVAPRNMIRLFNHGRARKKDGKAVVARKADAVPICASPLDGYSTIELLVVSSLAAEEKKSRDSGQQDG